LASVVSRFSVSYWYVLDEPSGAVSDVRFDAASWV
jgi:hypothetical protein